MSNEQLYENALDAINELFGDSTVSIQKALENLENLQSEIEAKIECLKEDLLREQEVPE